MSTAALTSETTETEEHRPNGVWDYISPSRLNLWLRCPLAFRIHYVDGIRTPTTPALFCGQRVHDSLEVHYRHRQLGITLDANGVVQRLVDTWDEAIAAEDLQLDSADESQRLKQQATGLVQAYLEHVGDQEPRPIAVETSLEAPLIDPATGEDLGIPLLGIVDLIQDDEYGPRICDFKTAAKSAAPFEITHEIQLSSYAYLFRQATGGDEGGLEIRSLIQTKTPKIEFHHYAARTDVHFRRLFAVIREYLDALDRGQFNFRPGFHCGMCDFARSQCREWSG
ncbi:MAG: PD-(D/E)XK nuclease family protein [Planctomycetota bacterium]|nr:PD-(D/E)XK nuclease family protein [Planctomycetota bacterium]